MLSQLLPRRQAVSRFAQTAEGETLGFKAIVVRALFSHIFFFFFFGGPEKELPNQDFLNFLRARKSEM